jgi:hypothetical protein
MKPAVRRLPNNILQRKIAARAGAKEDLVGTAHQHARAGSEDPIRIPAFAIDVQNQSQIDGVATSRPGRPDDDRLGADLRRRTNRIAAGLLQVFSGHPEWGNAATRGVLCELVTAAALLQAGSDIMVLRHPQSVQALNRVLINGLRASKEHQRGWNFGPGREDRGAGERSPA